MSPEINKLTLLIEKKLGWGDSKTWQSRDFEKLNQEIFEHTGISLSASTLRRIWGKVEYKHLPSVTTMDALARFAGYENWRIFLKQNEQPPAETNAITHRLVTVRPVRFRYWRKISWLFIVIIAGLATIFWVKLSKPAVIPALYHFSSRPVTRKIPNSVIFTYDASTSPTDSVFIQQSWDIRTKTRVDKKLHQFTAVYFEPGFYHAKLFIDTMLVKEHPLMVPTEGWLGLITHATIPVYLDSSEFIFRDSLQVGTGIIESKNMLNDAIPAAVKYYNVGNFVPVPLDSFSFCASVKNEFNKGAAACQFSNIFLYTDDVPVYIPISARGCVSELNLMNTSGEMISGKKADLSAFGADFTDWVKIACKSVRGKIQYWVDGKLAYEMNLPDKKVRIVGLSFAFQGTGAVKDISLGEGHTIRFQAF